MWPVETKQERHARYLIDTKDPVKQEQRRRYKKRYRLKQTIGRFEDFQLTFKGD